MAYFNPTSSSYLRVRRAILSRAPELFVFCTMVLSISLTAQQPTAAVAAQAPNATASISGTVFDPHGSVIQGASVSLKNSAGDKLPSVLTGANGEFTFSSLAAEPYRLTVAAPGFGAYNSEAIPLSPGQILTVGNVVLPVTASESVRVSGDPVELAEEQVKIATGQRVLGIIPDFYTSYDWNAPPMRAKQKFKLEMRYMFDPIVFVSVAANAGVEMYNSNWDSFGNGGSGFAKRFGAIYADRTTSRLLATAVLPSIFHEDPRYFYKGTGSVPSRAWYAITSAVIARSDKGKRMPSYSRIFAGFGSAAIASTYYPTAATSAGQIVADGFINIGDHAASNLIREFILKKISTRKGMKQGGQQ